MAARFWAKVDRRSPDECWPWQGSTHRGYGQFYRQGGSRLTHRIAYELLRGPIPTGLTLDHLCRNRSCVNPDHLEPVEAVENTRRSRVFVLGRPKPRMLSPEAEEQELRQFERDFDNWADQFVERIPAW